MAEPAHSLPDGRLYIGGEWRAGRGPEITSTFPADRSAHTQSRDTGKTLERLEIGTVWVKACKQFSVSAPFGGVKMSGIGREKGRDGIRAYMAQKSICWDTGGTPLPWAT